MSKFGKVLSSGNVVEVKLKNSDKMERGTVCCCDEAFNILILKTQDYSKRLFDVNVFNLEHIEDVKLKSESSKSEPTPSVDVEAVNRRLNETLRQREKRLKAPEPPADCLKVFDKLKEQFGGKNVTLTDDNQCIIFMDTVRIKEPYIAASCEFVNASSNSVPTDSSDKSQQTLNYARTQLSNARQQLGLPQTVSVQS